MYRLRAIVWGLLATFGTMSAAAQQSPPVAPVEVVTDDYYGTKLDDPYRWMESGKDSRWMPWLRGQSEFTRQTLDALPGRAAFLADTARLSGEATRLGTAILFGETVIYSMRPPGAEDPQLHIRTGRAPPRKLFDVAEHSQGKLAQDWFRISPDGRTVALGLSVRGSENSEIYLLDVATGTVTATGITQAQVTAWLPDSSGFSYLKMIGTVGQPDYFLNLQPRFRALRDGADRLLVARDTPPVPITPQQRPSVSFAPHGQAAVLTVSDGRRESALYVADGAKLLGGGTIWRRVADFPDLVTQYAAWGDRLWLLTRTGDGNGRILLTSLAAPDLVRAKAIALPGQPVINYISAVGATLVAETVGPGGQTALWRIMPDGGARRIALPFVGNALLNASTDGQTATLSLGGWFSPQAQYRLEADDRIANLDLGDKPLIDPAHYEAKVFEAVARDGTKVPYTIVSRKDFKRDGANPTLLEAYGSYGSVTSPFYQSQLLPFLDRGGVYVTAAVRGGGEFGRRWHDAGRATNKATTWRDAIDVAEALIASKVTSRRHLAIIGTSAGGVMVGGALNERPDLFAAVIANVGFMNPIRYVSEQNYTDIEEWGGPIADATSFRTMYDLDAYHHIKPGTAYPPTLVVSGINDPHAATFHGAKYAARLAAATTSGEPVLLRIDFDAGHGMDSRRSQLDATWTDIFSFVLWKTGSPGFAPRP